MVKNYFLLIISLFYFILSTPLSARADVYLATGVLTTKKATRIALAALRADLIKSNPELYTSQSFKPVYNTSHGLWDFIESAVQLFDQNGWSEYWNTFINSTNLAITQYYIDYFSGVSNIHAADLSEQITAYKNSITAGNQVIVIAHSQGNYFTNEAYAALSACQKKSFYMLGTANPASTVSGAEDGRGVLLTLDNDPITYVPSSMSPNVTNSERDTLAGVDFKSIRFHEFQYYRNSNDATKSVIDTFAEDAMSDFNRKYPPIEPKDYPIDIQLSWQSSDIQLQLISELGEKERSRGCPAYSRYYEEEIENTSPGTYKVYVTHSGEVDEKSLPQKLSLTIKTPGDALSIDVTITNAGLLNLGHVANIEIGNDDDNFTVSINDDFDDFNKSGLQLIVKHFKNIRVGGGPGGTGTSSHVNGGRNHNGCWVLDTLTYAQGVAICYPEGNDDTTNGAGTQTDDTKGDQDDTDGLVFNVKSKLNVAELGPIGGARVYLIDMKNDLILYETSTTMGGSLDSTGIIQLPTNVLEGLDNDAFYVLKVVGGFDIDSDDNGIIDETAVEKRGDIHAVLSGQYLKNNHFKINILTEIVYQVTKNMYTSDDNSSFIEDKLNTVAKKLLIANHQNISYSDVVQWMPRFDKRKLKKRYTSVYAPVVQKIYDGVDVETDAYNIVYEPILLNYIVSLKEDSNLSDKVLTIDVGSEEGKTYTLSGADSTLFYVNTLGEVYFVDGATIDYEQQREYDLSLVVTSGEYLLKSKLTIKVKNILDAPEVNNFETIVDDSLEPSSLIGKLSINVPDDAPVLEVVLSENDTFSVDINGDVKLKENMSLDYFTRKHYDLNLTAYNKFGSSSITHIIIDVTNIKDNVVLNNLDMFVDENIDTVDPIGKIDVLEYGDEEIRSFVLTGNDATYFNISNLGEIYFKEGMSPNYEDKKSYLFNTYALTDTNQSNEAEIAISINNVIEINTFSDFEGAIKEDAKAGTGIGTLSKLIDGDMITSMRLVGADAETFNVDLNGTIYLASNTLNYDLKSQYNLKLVVNNEVDTSLYSDVIITVNAVNLNFAVGIGRWEGALSNLYIVENNGSKTLLFSDISSVDSNISTTATVNSHHLELKADKIYLYEVSGGTEIDSNLDGIRDEVSIDNNGTLHAYVKGVWLKENDNNLSINLMTEAFYQWVNKEVHGFDIASLSSSLDEGYTPICRQDLSGNETQWHNKCSCEDALYYSSVNHDYAWNFTYISNNDLRFIREQLLSDNEDAINYLKNTFYKTFPPQQHRHAVTNDEKSLYLLKQNDELLYINLDENLSTQTPAIISGSIEKMGLSSDRQFMYTLTGECVEGCTYSLNINDIQSNTTLYQRSSINTNGQSLLGLTSTVAFLSSGYSLGLVDLQDKDTPLLYMRVFSYQLGEFTGLKAFDSTHILIANNKGGISYIDISDITNLQLLDNKLFKGHINQIYKGLSNKFFTVIENENNTSIGELEIVNNRLVLLNEIPIENFSIYYNAVDGFAILDAVNILIVGNNTLYRYTKNVTTNSWDMTKEEAFEDYVIGDVSVDVLVNSSRIIITNGYKIFIFDLNTFRLLETLEYDNPPT